MQYLMECQHSGIIFVYGLLDSSTRDSFRHRIQTIHHFLKEFSNFLRLDYKIQLLLNQDCLIYSKKHFFFTLNFENASVKITFTV